MSIATATRRSNTLKVRDQRTFKVKQVKSSRLGEFLWQTRLATPSEEREGNLSRRELAEVVNGSLAPGEPEITPAVIQRIERGENKFGGYYMRILQICGGLDLKLALNTRGGRRALALG